MTERSMFWMLNVGRSHYWVGFTRCKHRSFELLMPMPRPAKASGPPKAVDAAKEKAKRQRLPR